MAMVALALNPYGQSKAQPQKPPSDAPGDLFTALLKSPSDKAQADKAPADKAQQKPGLSQTQAAAPADLMSSKAQSRHPMAKNAEPGQPAAADSDSSPDSGSSDDTSQNLLAPAAQSQAAQSQAVQGTIAATPPGLESGAKKSCENPKDQIKGADTKGTDAKGLPFTDAAGSAVTSPPVMPLAPVASTVPSDPALPGYIQGPGHIQGPDDIQGADNIQGMALAKLVTPSGFPIPGKPAAGSALITPGDDFIFDKTVANNAAAVTAAAATGADPAFQAIGITPQSATPSQTMTVVSPQSSLSNIQASANTAMADANRAVALRVSRAIRSGEDTLTIELHPAELGHVAVHIAFHANGVDVQMLVGREETYRAFNQDRAALEQQFSQAGIDLGSGGLDLRHNRTSGSDAKQTWTPASPQQGDGSGEANMRAVFLGDNLVNIVA